MILVVQAWVAALAAICHFFKKVLRTLVARHYQAMAQGEAEGGKKSHDFRLKNSHFFPLASSPHNDF